MYTPTERKRYAMWELLKHRKYPMLRKPWHHHSLDLALKKNIQKWLIKVQNKFINIIYMKIFSTVYYWSLIILEHWINK